MENHSKSKIVMSVLAVLVLLSIVPGMLIIAVHQYIAYPTEHGSTVVSAVVPEYEKRSSFHGEVLKVKDGNVYISVLEQQEELQKGEQVEFASSTVPADKMPKLSKGDKIEVIYHTVTREVESDRITLETVFAIYKLDEL